MAKSNFIVRGGGDFSGLYREFNTAQKKINTFQAGLSKTMKGLGVVFGTVAIGRTIKDFVTTAARTEVLDVAMQSVARSSGYATAALKEHKKAVMEMGIAEQEATQILTRFMQAQLDTADASKLARVAQDAAVIAGMDSSEAAEQMTEAIAKQRPILLAQFGMMSGLEDMYREYAKTVGKSASQLSKAEKQQAMLNYILKEGEKIAGTYEASMGVVGKQISSLPRYWQTLQNAIATPLALPGLGVAVDAITESLKSAIAWAEANGDTLRNWGQTVANVVGGAIKGFGFLAQTLAKNWSIIKSVGAVLLSYIIIAKAATAVTSAFEFVTSILNGTIASNVPVFSALSVAINTYRLQMALAPVSTNLFTGALLRLRVTLYAVHAALGPIGWIILGITAAVTGGMAAWSKYTNSLQKTASVGFGDFREAERKMAAGANESTGALDDQAEALKKAGKAAKGSVAGFDEINQLQDKMASGGAGEDLLDDIDLGGMDVGGIPGFDLDDMLNELEMAKPSLAGFWEWTKNGFASAWKSVKTKWDGLPKWFTGLFSPLTSAISPVLEGIKTMFGGLIMFLKGVFTGDWKMAWEGVKQIFKGVFDTLAAIARVPFELIKGFAIGAWEAIKKAWGIAAPWFNDTVVTPIKNFFIGLWDGIKLLASTAWDNIKRVWETASEWFGKNVLGPVEKAFKGSMNFLIGLAEGFVNGFIKGINAIIDALNKISFDIPDWVPGIGGNSFGINIPSVSNIKIPRLAKGGITNGPTLAMIGDNPGGKEVVSPLDDLVDIIASAVGSAVMNAMQFGGAGSDQGGDTVINVDGKELARATLTSMNKEAVRLGYKPILQTR